MAKVGVGPTEDQRPERLVVHIQPLMPQHLTPTLVRGWADFPPLFSTFNNFAVGRPCTIGGEEPAPGPFDLGVMLSEEEQKEKPAPGPNLSMGAGCAYVKLKLIKPIDDANYGSSHVKWCSEACCELAVLLFRCAATDMPTVQMTEISRGD